jgi:hypothetical protein
LVIESDIDRHGVRLLVHAYYMYAYPPESHHERSLILAGASGLRDAGRCAAIAVRPGSDGRGEPLDASVDHTADRARELRREWSIVE